MSTPPSNDPPRRAARRFPAGLSPATTLALVLMPSIGSASCIAEPEPEVRSFDAHQEPDGPEPIGEAVFALTVAEAADSSCSTASVKGLSEQIVAQANCIAPGAFVKVPSQPNLVLGGAVFAYLEQPAKDAFVAALQAKSNTTMQVNSMLRTVAQQYLLYRWYKNGQCGIALAATPGNSNHETGLALDVQQYNTWKSTLQAHGFKWYGNSDPVHFDYVGPGAKSYKGTDVLAFQILWNANNPDDPIAEDGLYGPQTEARLKKAPANGFAKAPSCDGKPDAPDVHPSVAIVDAADAHDDGSSKGALDLLEGDTYELRLEIVNKGKAVASTVELGVELDGEHLAATDYLIETDWKSPGSFHENDANTHPSNPPHDEALPAAFSLHMNALSPGETKRVTIGLLAKAYSISGDPAPFVRLWVKDVAGYYQQAEFGGAAKNQDASQTFNKGKLEVALAADVYSRTRWEWDSDRLEGWSPLGGATLAADPGAGVLVVGAAESADPGLAGPETSFAAADHGRLVLRARRTGGTGAARLYFATADEPEMDEAKAVAFEVPDDEAFHEVAIEAGENALWAGTVTALRIDPFEEGPGTLEIDFLRVESAEGSTGSGGPGGTTAGAGGDGAGGAETAGSGGYPFGEGGGDFGPGAGPDGDPGCECAAPGVPARAGSVRALAAGLLLALAAIARRRRSAC